MTPTPACKLVDKRVVEMTAAYFYSFSTTEKKMSDVLSTIPENFGIAYFNKLLFPPEL